MELAKVCQKLDGKYERGYCILPASSLEKIQKMWNEINKEILDTIDGNKAFIKKISDTMQSRYENEYDKYTTVEYWEGRLDGLLKAHKIIFDKSNAYGLSETLLME